MYVYLYICFSKARGSKIEKQIQKTTNDMYVRNM